MTEVTCPACGGATQAGYTCPTCKGRQVVPAADISIGDTSDMLIRQQLHRWRMELLAAPVVLRGKYLEEFRDLIIEVAKQCNIRLAETGSFQKVELPK